MSAVLQGPEYNFRPMCELDLPAVLEIEQCAYQFPWSKRIFHNCLRVGYSCWVFEEGSTVIGYGIISVAVGECHILNLCINPEEQGRGYGRFLLDFLMDIARDHGADTAFLEVRPSNTTGIQLYQKAGFDEVGTRKNYYPHVNGREDAIIFARKLVS
ncbi:MAG: ribosomal protein S18-alanine N-acetyltransferase [Thiotrichales bacterium]|nr:ribosomal protein S18-alanine N-acetyltransferase [Thiotrichales bacterium]